MFRLNQVCVKRFAYASNCVIVFFVHIRCEQLRLKLNLSIVKPRTGENIVNSCKKIPHVIPLFTGLTIKSFTVANSHSPYAGIYFYLIDILIQLLIRARKPRCY